MQHIPEKRLLIVDEKHDGAMQICRNNGYKWTDPQSTYYVFSAADMYLYGFVELECSGSFVGRNNISYVAEPGKKVWFTPYKNYIYNNLVHMGLEDQEEDPSNCGAIYVSNNKFVTAAHCFEKDDIRNKIESLNIYDEQLQIRSSIKVNGSDVAIKSNPQYNPNSAASIGDVVVFEYKTDIVAPVIKLQLDKKEYDEYSFFTYSSGQTVRTSVSFSITKLQNLSSSEKLFYDDFFSELRNAKHISPFRYQMFLDSKIRTFLLKKVKLLDENIQRHVLQLAGKNDINGLNQLDAKNPKIIEFIQTLIPNVELQPVINFYELSEEQQQLIKFVFSATSEICPIIDEVIAVNLDDTFIKLNFSPRCGDSGGPIFILNSVGQYELVGVVILNVGGNAFGCRLQREYFNMETGGYTIKHKGRIFMYLLVAIIFVLCIYLLKVNIKLLIPLRPVSAYTHIH